MLFNWIYEADVILLRISKQGTLSDSEIQLRTLHLMTWLPATRAAKNFIMYNLI